MYQSIPSANIPRADPRGIYLISSNSPWVGKFGKNMASGQKIFHKNPTPGEKFLPNKKRLQTVLMNIASSMDYKKLSLRALSAVSEDYIFKIEKEKYKRELEEQTNVYYTPQNFYGRANQFIVSKVAPF